MAETASITTELPPVRCCIAGGGPGGVMLGFLLARAGVETLVLEKHADFLRDFRGDTIHPSTLELMHELGLLTDFLARPHQEATELTGWVGDATVTVADFTHLPTRCRFIAFMPQWDFLDFLAGRGRRYPTFHLRMQAEVTDLIEEGGRVAGVRATTPRGPLEVRAALVVAADGRHSTVRARAGLQVEDLGAPMDVLWLRLPRRPEDPRNPLGRFDRGRVFVMLDRGDYWQCGLLIPKGGWDAVRQRGLGAFRDTVAAVAPFLSDRVGDLRAWEDVKLLTVVVDRLRRWYRPGLLCIGDAAHAMSPIGGVGINLAIQDAVATANLLAGPLHSGTVTVADLRRVQLRRAWPTRLTQRLQVFVQERVIRRVLGSRRPVTLPWPLRLLRRFPVLRRLTARLIGMGVRPEHVKTPDVFGTDAAGPDRSFRPGGGA
jgi:2-polyprenyl-6-methoxyphenol hydroxylase-like FAD-dependent oxidoreductase